MPAASKPEPPEKTAAAPAAPAAPGSGLSLVQRALRKLGLVRDIDFALYLPMRYEDETRIVRLADTRDGDMAQVEGVVTECEVVYRPRRQLLATIDDGSDTCQLRFFNFYPSQQKQLAIGARVRVRGEMRGGFVGRQMMHPTVKAAGTALPNALTPVYSTVAGLAQPVLRREVRSGLARAVLDETIPVQIGLRGAWDLRASLSFLHYPTPDVAMATLEDHSHPAWQRIKAEELLAQQLSQLQARLERAAQRAPVLPAPAEPVATSLHAQLLAVLPFGLTGAQQRVGEEITRDLGARDPDAPPAAGRRGFGQDRGGGARGGALHRRGFPVRADGAHRNPRGAAFRQARRLARSAAGRARPARGVAHGQPEEEGARWDVRRRRKRRGGAGHRHPRGHLGEGALQESRAGHHRRAASLRRGAAPGLARQGGRRIWSRIC